MRKKDIEGLYTGTLDLSYHTLNSVKHISILSGMWTDKDNRCLFKTF